jgi:hypothetical protein
MSLPNSQHCLVPDDHQEPAIVVTREHRVPHLPLGISREVGSVFENVHGMGMAALRLQEARLSGSATIMQFACEEIAELAQSAAALAKHLEHTLAEHRRRNPEAGIRR